MDFVSFLTTDVLVVLAVDLGLVILLIWFLVLWCILRVMRQFARQATQDSHIDNKTYEVCQESVSNALNFTAENSDTLNDLILIQQALENQVSQIRSAGELSDQEKASVEELNQKLNKSHQLIRKLKVDLNKSTKGLEKAKSKLLQQTGTVESLQQEKEQLEKQFEQLEQEYIQLTEADDSSDLAKEHQEEKRKMLDQLEAYKKKLSNQGDSEALTAALQASKQQLYHVAKEKDFIEQKYLDLLAESEQKNEQN
ncbi:chromosome partitioning protein ParA [Vibrio caribbeanicus]|uniref:chromosome partitioning protein ParA n=1 Tax=Vibrio caribbeanicus TaxID=701175 RepID=UPI0030D8843E